MAAAPSAVKSRSARFPPKNRSRMRGPEVANVSRRRMASKMASRVFASAHTAAKPLAP